MKVKFTQSIVLIFLIITNTQSLWALSGSDVNIRNISGYFWLDNQCTAGGPQGKVVSFRIRNTKGSNLYGVKITLGTVGFTAVSPITYTSGTPSFTCRTSTTVYIGDIPAGDSATAFFFVGYNCLLYPNNTNITTDYVTLPVTVADNLSGTVSTSFNKLIYVLRNSNNNTITILATSLNTIGTLATLSVAYNISNVKPGNIIDMEISTLNTFPAGYEIVGCRFTASTITTDFPVGMTNTHYCNSIVSNLPSGGSVTIEWYLKITGTSTGLNSSNLVPFVVSDAGSAQRWQANVTAFTGTSTPVNPLSITKRVNNSVVEINDTVYYTIVIHNSSTTADVTIDRLVDNLPRDYQFRYIETNLGIFPRLVTYSNSTLYPEFQDTNYLFFDGHKALGGGAFSWVVPKQDSIKLIYSAKVSGTPGWNDTNFVSAYIGNTNVGTAFARLNVYALLPVKLIYFDASNTGDVVELKWAVDKIATGTSFELFRKTHDNADPVLISRIYPESNQCAFNWSDLLEDEEMSSNVTYILKVHTPEGESLEYMTQIGTEENPKSFLISRSGNGFDVYSLIPNLHNVQIQVYDLAGRTLYDAQLYSADGIFRIPAEFAKVSGQYIFIRVSSGEIKQVELAASF